MYSLLGSGISAIANSVNTAQTNKYNLQIARETNAANREMVEMQNKAAKEEAELAYQRSKSTTQVQNMQAAGMSRAGAINALNGGGSYTPAPVNVSQDQAAKMETADLSALANIGQRLAEMSQRKHEEKMQSKQIAAAKEQQQAQLESNERIAQLQADTTNRNADNRLNWDKKVFETLSPYQIRQIESNISKVNSDIELSQVQKEDLQYKYSEYVSNRSVRDAVSLLQELEADYNYHVTQADFNDFKRSYMYYDDETDSYQYITHTKSLTKVEAYAAQFWDVMAKIFPANKIGRIVSVALGK